MADNHSENRDAPLSKAKQAYDAVERARNSNKSWADRRREMGKLLRSQTGWKRETLTLPREEARAYAKAFLKKYPKQAYWSEVESWRVLEDDIIEFTMRRLPTAD
ncbi:MAG: hypothetical protein AAGF54_03230 [Pseudomonadota bacterium]